MRVAVTGFCKALVSMSPNSQISLMEFGQAAVTVAEYERSDRARKGCQQAVPAPNAPSVLTEAVIEGNKRLAKKPGNRKTIVVLNIEPNNGRPIRTATGDGCLPEVERGALGGPIPGRQPHQSANQDIVPKRCRS